MKTSWGPALVAAMAAALCASCVAKNSVASADQLEIKATFTDVESSSDGKQPVAVQFFEVGEYVNLRNGATIRCNGIELAQTSLGFIGRIPLMASGDTYKITHDLDGDVATLQVTVPARPAITSPAPGAQLPRTVAQTITFTAVSGSMVRSGAAGPGGTSAGTWQPDSGMVTVDATAVGAGTGTISVMRQLEGTVAGSGFAKAQFSYSIEKSLTVVWQ